MSDQVVGMRQAISVPLSGLPREVGVDEVRYPVSSSTQVIRIAPALSCHRIYVFIPPPVTFEVRGTESAPIAAPGGMAIAGASVCRSVRTFGPKGPGGCRLT